MFNLCPSFRRTLWAIIRHSLLVKAGGSIWSLFLLLRVVRDDFLPEKWRGQLRLLNLILNFHWYIWVIAVPCILLLGVLEGIARWSIVPLAGWPGSLQNDAFQTATKMQNFIRDFISNNGKMPVGDTSKWCGQFTALFRSTLKAEVREMLDRIEAEGVRLDSSITGLLDRAYVVPDDVMSIAGQLIAAGMSLSLK